MPRTQYSPRLSDSRFVIAAYDSTADGGAEVADFVCDGVSDEIEINQAIALLPSRGGTIHLDAGQFNLSGPIIISDNKRVLIQGFGALIVPGSGVTAILIQQGISSSRGVTMHGFRIDGTAGGTTGIELRDTNNSSLLGLEIENCTTGILLRSFASGMFVEGTQIDNCLLRNNTTGVAFRTVSGTGSFMQTMIRNLKVTGSTTGLDFDNPGLFLRSIVQGTFWIDTNQTGVDIDGNMEDSTFDVAFEGAGGATGNTGLVVGTNATNTDQTFFKLLFTGTIATQVTANSKNFQYWSGGSQLVNSAGTATWGFKRHGDSTDRLRFTGPTNGGKIEFGNGTLLDTNLYRNAASILVSDDKIDPASINVQVKAGTPVDGDITGGAADGDFVADSTGNKLWVRLGGTWKGVVVA